MTNSDLPGPELLEVPAQSSVPSASSADPSAAAGPAPGGGGPSAADPLLAANRDYAAAFRGAGAAAHPVRRVTVVTCMDARINVHAVLGLEPGDAHVLRNAGGVVTDDIIRSLAVSQRGLGTTSVMLVHHSRCGMLSMTEDFCRELEDETGVRPGWRVQGFTDIDQDVRDSVERVRTSPFLPHRDDVRGFVYDVDTGLLREVH